MFCRALKGTITIAGVRRPIPGLGSRCRVEAGTAFSYPPLSAPLDPFLTKWIVTCAPPPEISRSEENIEDWRESSRGTGQRGSSGKSPPWPPSRGLLEKRRPEVEENWSTWKKPSTDWAKQFIK